MDTAHKTHIPDENADAVYDLLAAVVREARRDLQRRGISTRDRATAYDFFCVLWQQVRDRNERTPQTRGM